MRLFKRIQYNAPVVLTFSLLSLLALLLGRLTDGGSTRLLFCVYRSPLSDPLTYVRMFTHVLGHAGAEHYLNNILLMLVLGPTLEEKYGSMTLLTTMCVTAVIAGLVQWAFFPSSALLGASGLVFMMIVMSSLAGMHSGRIPLTLIFVVIFYLGGEIVSGIFTADNVSQLTHLIGGVCGAFAGFIIARK